MVRSVRIATHPELRRQGLAARLVDHVHASYAPDLFGTLFGATPDLLRFRRSVGYALVRVGTTRGSRTGEPAAVMVRPASPRAVPLVDALRHQLARDLPLQLQLFAAEDALGLTPPLTASLLHDLPAPARWTDERRREAVRSWADGPRPFEAAAGAIRRSVGAVPAQLDDLSDDDRDLVCGRVFEGRPWRQLAAERGWTVRQTMRAVRRLLGPKLVW
jgi:tRNA(Met) cytidine acetyltransferase